MDEVLQTRMRCSREECMTERIHVLFIEHLPAESSMLRALLHASQSPEYAVESCTSQHAALARLDEGHIDIVVLDLDLADTAAGLEGLRRLQQQIPALPVVVLVPPNREDLGRQAMQLGAQDYLRRPLLETDLLTRVLRHAVAQKRSATLLQQAHQDRQTLLSAVRDSLVLLDAQGRVLLANDAFYETFALAHEEVEGQPFLHLRQQAWDQPPLRAALEQIQQRPPARLELDLEISLASLGKRSLKIQVRRLLAIPDDDRLLLTIEDVTERALLQRQMEMAQRMESIGRLAAGLAHDFNNLLTVIVGCSDLLLSGADIPAADLVERIKDTGLKAATLTRQLLAISRRQILAPVILDLNTLVQDMEKILSRTLDNPIRLTLALDSQPVPVKADPGQLENVLLNLVLNARDAMPNGGQLIITTGRVYLDESCSRWVPEVPPGHYALLTVSDTGCGMDEETLTHIFEPFFTTKEVGKGTGLGLAMVYGTIKQSGGCIQVDSQPGRGTDFRLYLPQVQAEGAAPIHWVAENGSLRGQETILVVEEDASVRRMVQVILSTYGYTVLMAHQAEEALQLCRDHPQPIHLLITDVLLPRVSGGHLADLVRQIRPHIKALYTSSYPPETLAQSGWEDLDEYILQKPFASGTLARKVRDTLDRS